MEQYNLDLQNLLKHLCSLSVIALRYARSNALQGRVIQSGAKNIECLSKYILY